MTTDYPTDEVPATPEYVLAVLSDWYALLLGAGQVCSGLRIAAETTVERFADEAVDPNWGSCDWRTVAGALNEMWAVNIPEREWQPVLTPPRDRTLGDVARFLAGHVQMQGIRPWRHVGGDCLPAGAFLTARAMFVRAGADRDTITPSTPLEPLLTRFFNDVGWEMARLAPGWLPLLRVEDGWGASFARLGYLVFLVALASSGCWLMVLGSVLIAAGSLAGGPRRAGWPGIVTFRDLAYALAGQEPRRRIQPTP